MHIAPLLPADLPEVETLLDRAFGPGRGARPVAALRRGAPMLAPLSFTARAEGGALLGSVQCWPVRLDTPAGASPLTLLGPLAVDPDRRGEGVGAALMSAALAAAGDRPVVLVGDEPYYGRWGFAAGPTADWRLPGHAEPARLLARNAAGLPRHGTLGPAQPARRAA